MTTNPLTCLAGDLPAFRLVCPVDALAALDAAVVRLRGAAPAAADALLASERAAAVYLASLRAGATADHE